MTKKDWILLIAMILFCLWVSQVQAQKIDIRERCKDVVRGSRVELVDSPKAYEAATYLSAIFLSNDSNALRNAMDKMDDSWYDGLDVYICDDEECLLDTIRADEKAYFRQATTAAVFVARDEEVFITIIFSWK